jgi:hypothetical protein
MPPPNSTKHGAKAGAEFMARPKYKSTVPALPFDPKSLKFPFPSDMLVAYRLTSLERTAQYTFPMPDAPVDLVSLGVLDADHCMYPQICPSSSYMYP